MQRTRLYFRFVNDFELFEDWFFTSFFVKVDLEVAGHLQHVELIDEAFYFCVSSAATADALADFDLDVFSCVELKVAI